MAEEELSKEDEKAMQQLGEAVAKDLAAGREPKDIADDLAAKGMSSEDALDIVMQVKTQMEANVADDEGGGGWGWLLWLGALGLINLLSWLFDWSFWIY